MSTTTLALVLAVFVLATRHKPSLFPIFVRGLNGRSLCLTVTAETTVRELLTMLKHHMVDHTRLWHANKRLDETVAASSLASLGIDRDATLELQGLLAGGTTGSEDESTSRNDRCEEAHVDEKAPDHSLGTQALVVDTMLSDEKRSKVDELQDETPNKRQKVDECESSENEGRADEGGTVDNGSHQSEQQVRLRESLDEHIQHHDLADLHTHLLGMGRADFWIQELRDSRMGYGHIEMYASAVEFRAGDDFRERSARRVDFFKQILGDGPDNGLAPGQCAPITHYDRGFKLQPNRVKAVFDDLKRALNGEERAHRRWYNAPKGLIDEGLRIAILRDEELEVTLQAVVSTTQLRKSQLPLTGRSRIFARFNVRTQVFEKVQGFTVEELCSLGDDDLHDAFTVRTMDPITFTPDFCPRCFVVKDVLYQHDLTVLDRLLDKVLTDYYKNGVRYVEFSMGYKDLVLRPWVFHHLILGNHGELSDGTRLRDDGTGIWFNYLAALSRQDVLLRFDNRWRKPNPEEAASFLAHHGSQAIDLAFAEASTCSMYRNFDKAADDMGSAYNAIPESGDDGTGLLARVVGLDLVGDEYGYPYCPFWRPRFVEFARERMRQNNRHLRRDGSQFRRVFGLRPHLGEVTREGYEGILRAHSVAASANEVYATHCGIMERIVISLFEEVYRSPPQTALRFGHGVAAICDSIFRHLHAEGIVPHLMLHFEACPTSNYRLLKGFEGHPALEEGKRVHCLVCTDDDGIIPTTCNCPEEPKHHLVAGEVCKLISRDTFKRLLPSFNYIGFRAGQSPETAGWDRIRRLLQKMHPP